MARHGLPQLPMYYNSAGEYSEQIELPYISKHVLGENDVVFNPEKGKDTIKKNVFMIEEMKDWSQDRLTDHDNKDYFIQQLADKGVDYRTFISRHKGYIGGWKREAPKDNFMTVTSGATYTMYNEPEDDIMEVVNLAIEKLQPDFMALDFIRKDGKPMVLEISLHPGFKAYETKCEGGEPVNVAKAIVECF